MGVYTFFVIPKLERDMEEQKKKEARMQKEDDKRKEREKLGEKKKREQERILEVGGGMLTVKCIQCRSFSTFKWR